MVAKASWVDIFLRDPGNVALIWFSAFFCITIDHQVASLFFSHDSNLQHDDDLDASLFAADFRMHIRTEQIFTLKLQFFRFNLPTSYFLKNESQIKSLLRLFHSRACCYARAPWQILRKALFALLTLQLSWQQITYIGKERTWWWGVCCLVHN